MKIYTGTSGYGYKEWKGNFYPQKISADAMLPFYSQKLETVEINNTFYRMPTEHAIISWAEQVPQNFMFVIKAPQVITHVKRLKNTKEETKFFLKSLSRLESRLGAVLFQFPGSFRQDKALLADFLDLIPPQTPCAFDFRSVSWLKPDVFELLGKKGFCLCMEDTDEKPVQEIIGTTSWGYLRLRRMDYSASDLSQWAKKILAQKWDKAFVFFKHEDDAAARGPALALSFRELAG